jgi:hypothetical protein
MEQAMRSPAWEALEESDDDAVDGESGAEPGTLSGDTKQKSGGGDDAWDDDDDLRASPFGLSAAEPKPKKEHSASFSENPGWLKAILEKPEPGRRRSSAGRRL